MIVTLSINILDKEDLRNLIKLLDNNVDDYEILHVYEDD